MSTPTSTLAAFIEARIAEDEGIARCAEESEGGDWWTTEELVPKVGGEVYDLPDADHIAHFSPARVLAECEAKRRVLSLHSGGEDVYADYCPGEDGRYLRDQCPTLMALAAVYADHPEWRDSWRWETWAE